MRVRADGCSESRWVDACSAGIWMDVDGALVAADAITPTMKTTAMAVRRRRSLAATISAPARDRRRIEHELRLERARQLRVRPRREAACELQPHDLARGRALARELDV